ncbi:hypothetical protein BDN70DRAFT_938909 [Pholiota conissans]|uniref:Uncharacterized protein n=1 Tax=Pholiota conissans TaxID=109636 RepID=A0A9P5YME0_9AGAR|nr:hypothetical protein BDN70DRAFT_938909 [Pholiota conissans]
MRRITVSHRQLVQKLEGVEKMLDKDKFLHLNTVKALDRARMHKKTYEDFFSLAGSQDIPGLHRILKTAKCQGWSAEKLLDKTRKASLGQYLAKIFSDLDAALFPLQKSPFAFPSGTTIIAHSQGFKLRITIGSVTMSDILASIEAMFKDVKPEHRKTRTTLVGFANRAVTQEIRDGRVHIGQEVFVAAIARNDDTGFGAKPVLAVPTCKQGSYHESALVMEMIRHAWKISPYGEALHGSLWSIASDGDPKRRPALYQHCMQYELKEGDKLFEYLDYKHNMKRICKCICTREGLLIDGVVINKSLLATWLERLTEVDWSDNTIYSLLNPESSMIQRINALLSPKDMQDVPRAIKLLSLTADLRKLDTSDFDPSEISTHRALSLLGEMLDALLEPFINPESSISQQITSLIKFSHIACALFLKHETDFMPLHLYSDLQCMVRTAIYRLAHSLILDPERKVLLCLLGDDVLEVLFGRTKMIGGHSPNVDVDELRQRFGSSPRNWRGDLRVITCNLQKCWKEGVAQAEAVLAKAGYVLKISEHFRDWRVRGVDLLQPKGGKYPGISLEVDRSLGDFVPAEGHEEIIGPDDLSFRFFDGKKALADEETRRMTEAGQEKLHSIWMDLEEGKPPGHKKTILRLFTDQHWILIMVQVTIDFFAFAPICIDKKVSVAILQCTSLKCAASLEAVTKSRAAAAATTTRFRHLSFIINGSLVLPLNPYQSNQIGVCRQLAA